MTFSLRDLLPELQRADTTRAWLAELNAGSIARASAVAAARPALAAAVHAARRSPTLLVTARPARARQLYEEIRVWAADPARVFHFPEPEAFAYERLRPDPETAATRRSLLARLAALSTAAPGAARDGQDAPPLIVTSVRALLDRLMTPDEMREHTVALQAGTSIRPERLLDALVRLGYSRVSLVENPGEFARRGSIVDVFPASDPSASVVEVARAAPPASGAEVGEPADDGSTNGGAVRIDFFSDEVDSLRRFDPVTQRSLGMLDACVLAPAYEVLPTPTAEGRDALAALALGDMPDDLASAYAREREQLLDGEAFPFLEEYRAYLAGASLLDYLPREGLLLLDEPTTLAEAAAGLERQAAELQVDLAARREAPAALWPALLPWPDLERRIEAGTWAHGLFELDPAAPGPFDHAPSYAGRLRAFLTASVEAAQQERVVVVSQQDARLRELLADEVGASAAAAVRPLADLAAGPGLAIVHGSLQEGWRNEALGLSIVTDREVFGWSKTHRVVRARRPTGRESFLSDLEPGEYVVHMDHGIGRYRGLVTLSSAAPASGGVPTQRSNGEAAAPPADGAATREYLLVEYGDGDHLYVPSEQSDRVSRYVGAAADKPHLTRLSTGEWSRAKQRVRRAVREIAHDLIELYATREVQEGHPFATDSPWQLELEGSFPYVETPDQLAALAEVKTDMESPRPMDRLLVGDVGYGKTEIALRAAFKAVMDGKQVAILVPTTVLAQQHFNTFSERLAAFPTRVEMLSRFRTEREQREVLEGLRNGTVDICIGTHRLLQRDVGFKDLGLVIIDEEQRFGVGHKERLKQLRRQVDVLTLTATPIPRTLHMAVVGVRDMSTMATPPEDRLPIRTFVMQHDDGLVREAILRELDRGGQVYFVHNRVRTIAAMAHHLAELVPEARIAVGHGQMPEDELEQVMLTFAQGECDVLVCSTIIESGLDIPNVNTIIVHQAQRFGLAQLYQLRGRVGRGANRAYAYFLYTRDSALTETAEQRLRAVFEATELGAGFRIAMKDLEIRGAGNLLGSEQHGHIAAVGFDLYCRLLAEAVDSLRALRAAPADRPPVLDGGAPAASVSLPLPAYLPTAYVPDDSQRLRLYQRLAAVRTFEELGGFFDELEDRYGKLPDVAENLAYLVRLRLAATDAGIREIDADNERIVLRFRGLPPRQSAAVGRRLGLSLSLGSNQIRLPRAAGTSWVGPLRDLVDALAEPAAAAELDGARSTAPVHAGSS
jgi:transcription-repair coupling factor (superfamily II helicase)